MKFDKTILAAATLYAATFMAVYILYLNPTYVYAHFVLIERSNLSILVTLFIAVIPVLLYRGLNKISSFIATFIYSFCYAPTIITILLALDRPILEIFILQASLMVGMMLFFVADRVEWTSGPAVTIKEKLLPMPYVHGLTLWLTLLVIVGYWNEMAFVGFEDVYEHRFASLDIDTGRFVGYVVMWLTYALYPFYLAYGVFTKRWSYFAAGTAGSILIYTCVSSKVSLLVPVIVLACYVLITRKSDLLRNVLLALSISSLLLLIVPENETWDLVKAIYFSRSLGVGGWTNYIYYDYFTSTEAYSYYSHINVINWLTNHYSADALSLGQTIGLAYSGTELANFNANFWASDGSAALGLAGIFIINVVMFVYLVILNHVSRGIDLKLFSMFMIGHVAILLNSPLSTSIMSGGVWIILGIIWLVQLDNATRLKKSGFSYAS